MSTNSIEQWLKLDKISNVAECSWCHYPIQLSWRECYNNKDNKYTCPHCGRCSKLFLRGEYLASASIVGVIAGIGLAHLLLRLLGPSLFASAVALVAGILFMRLVRTLAENYHKVKHGILI